MKKAAKQLIEKFYFALPNNGSFSGTNNINDRWNEAVDCALIAVDEIIDAMDRVLFPNPFRQYWETIKEEIEKQRK
jgi:hypothetical protein